MRKYRTFLIVAALSTLALPCAAQQVFNNPGTTMVLGSAATSSTLTGIPGGTILTVRGGNSDPSRITVDSAGTGVSSGFVGRSARGTITAPTASQTDDLLASYQAFGYGATSYSSTAAGSILIRAGGNWTDASHPTYVGFYTTPTGSTTIAERLRVAADGTLQHLGTSSGTVTLTAQAAAGTPTLTWPTGSGTFAVSATSPLALSATTGALTCSTCGVTGTGLNQFASTTSAQLFGVISDETGGGGVLVGNASPTFTTSITAPLVIGGTGTTATLSLQSTSGAGGSTDKIKFLVGNNGATNAGEVYGTGLWNIGATDVTPDSLITVMANTAAAVTPTAGTHLHVVGADAAATRILLDNFGSSNVFNARHASGTLASKTATASGSVMFAFGVAGWDGTSAYYSTASINFAATETFSTTLGGSQITFNTTPNGTHTLTTAMTLQQSGGLSVGSATDPGIGIIMANVGFRAGANSGQSVTTTVRASGGAADCTLIFTGGLKTGGTC